MDLIPFKYMCHQSEAIEKTQCCNGIPRASLPHVYILLLENPRT